MSVRIETLTGEGLKSHLTDLARLRIEVFRDFPYLYDGDHDYERKYLSKLGASPGGIIVGAFDGDAAVGAATGAPLTDQSPEIIQPFVERGDALSQYFYFGESVLRGTYRGQGIGVRFFELREARARQLGIPNAVFCAVVRPSDHPRRPKPFVPLDDFWRHRGYAPLQGYTCRISWKEEGEDAETPKLMQFWHRRLDT